MLWDTPMRILAAVAVVLGLAGCAANAPRPPVIDDVQMPATATIGASGNYEVQGLLSFHDDDNAVVKLRIFVPLVSQTFEYNASTALDRGTMALAVQFAPQTPKGPVDYEVSLVDSSGLESASRKLSVTLQ
jgi:hypothetical protein